jgi:hypothetical protein
MDLAGGSVSNRDNPVGAAHIENGYWLFADARRFRLLLLSCDLNYHGSRPVFCGA